MNYTYTQLTRVSPRAHRRHIWRARGSRLWRRYVRLAAALGNAIGTVVMTLFYFVVVPPFAWLARRSERRQPPGWTPIPDNRHRSPNSQY